MKLYGGVEVQLHAFLTSAVVGDELSASSFGSFTPRNEPPEAIF